MCMTGIYSCIFLGITKSVAQNFLYFFALCWFRAVPFPMAGEKDEKGEGTVFDKIDKIHTRT